MGGILARNLIAQKIKSTEISVIETAAKNKIAKLKYYKKAADLADNYKADIVFLAIKPQDAEDILKDFSQAKIFHKNTIFISILAGKKLDFFTKIFGKNAKIIRSMPNLPIEYGQGIFAYMANKNLSVAELKKMQNIFDNFGTSLELSREQDFDLITAIFGSGPAYIFLLQEIFAEILKDFNCPDEVATNLTNQLFYGSVLMSLNSGDFKNLKESVTSKNGTTAAALGVLEKGDGLKNIFKKAVKAAVVRSGELSE